MELDLTNIEFSKRDIEKEIIIPTELTEELAEDIGIHIGDGSMYKCNKEKTGYELFYSCCSREEIYLKHIIDLKKRLYNLKKFRVRKINNELRLFFNSKVMAIFYNKVLGFPFGSKCKTVDIPDIIKNCKDKRIIIGCIRGILDTDFGLSAKHRYGRIYPVLEGSFASKPLVLSLSNLFDRLGLRYNLSLDCSKFDKRTNKVYTANKITISGYKRINQFFNTINSNNPRYSKKLKEIKDGPEEI